ncbi:DUF932 domain-containing protein [Echinicola vietnamensis]|uniref:Phage/plasmid-related protein TIGR03299 n=1 Tax=Echinicola vietnamensis (strain DSM 17526 / LMG 23754 / KMM 6221) TaxID=926556 RepID=L0FZY2_ECHVK|nr:DUF932 domain-containing protein [Echinicola vietnamensis]AGA78185.1 phage/plasmid-related protein TIGR03299 [Echinicola vietnamensis DSM 17526]
MGHNIHFNESTGRHSFFSVKKPAWHKLGQVVEEHPTSKEAIEFAGLDYKVVKTPLFTTTSQMAVGKEGLNHQAPTLPVHSHFATLREDNHTVLGVVGKDYKVVQNADAFAFFDAIVKEGKGVKYETAGALGNGERIFITAKLPDNIRVGKDDLIDQYIFLTTSHDGTGSITAAFTPVRIVCQNTLNAAMGKLSRVVRIRHTSGAKERLAQAHKLMGIVTQSAKAMQQTFDRWTKVNITDRQVKRLIQQALAPNKETLDKLHKGEVEELSANFKNQCEDAFAYALMSEAQQMPTTKGTVFGAYNAVTGYFQNVRSFKSEEDKTKSILLGGTAQIKGQRAFNLCGEFVKHGEEVLD